MAGPWEDYAPAQAPQQAAPQSSGPWQDYQPAPAPAAPQQSPDAGWEHLSVLPFDVRGKDDVRFNSDAGLLGMAKNLFSTAKGAVTLPGDVLTGKVDPNSPDALKRAIDLAMIASPVSAGVRAGEGWAAVPKTGSPASIAAPTGQALLDAGGAAYNAVRDMGVDYSAPAVASMAQGVKRGLESDGILQNLAPKTHSIIDALSYPESGTVAPIQGLQAARRGLGFAARDFNNPTEQLAATRAIEKLDGFISAADPSSVVAGPAADAARTLTEANANYAAGKRSAALNGVEDAADLRAAAANSGKNIGNSIRSRIASLLLSPKAVSGFSPAEVDALRGVTEGTPLRNGMRDVGNLLGGGGGLGAAVTGGMASVGGASATGSPWGALAGIAAPAIGFAAKQGDNAMTRRALQMTDELTRQRSPLFLQMQENAPNVIASPDKRAALARMLMLSASPQPQQ